MECLSAKLEQIAENYHLNSGVRDKFIEDACQLYCCKWLADLIQPSDSVLELGFGEGLTVAALKHKAGRYTVVEGSRKLFDKMAHIHPDVEAKFSMFENFEASVPYDKILALHVLEHVDSPVTMAKRFRQWMSPTSELVVVVPNRNSLHRKLAYEMGLIKATDELSERDKAVGHQRVYDLEALRVDLDKSGFEIVSEHGFFLKILPNSMMLDFSEEILIALNAISPKIPSNLLANIGVIARLKR